LLDWKKSKIDFGLDEEPLKHYYHGDYELGWDMPLKNIRKDKGKRVMGP